jgi:membrane protease YdiL (CAAX protease family)
MPVNAMPEAGKLRTLWYTPAARGFAVAICLCVFALFVRAGWPLVLLSALALVAAALVIGRSLGEARAPAVVFGVSRPTRRAAALTVLGCALGCVLGIGLRWATGGSLLPAAPGSFVFVAAAIGATEELAYRGYVQGRLQALGALPAAAFAAMFHTGYKCALFAIPSAPQSVIHVDLILLAAGTFLGGLVFGALREFARSALPAIGAHVCFDVVVYGGLALAPWWVWP